MAGAGVREGCKNVGRRGGFQEVGKDAFCEAATGMSGFVMSMFEASKAESVEGLQISCHGNVTQQISAGIFSCGSCRRAYASAHLFRGSRSTFEASA